MPPGEAALRRALDFLAPELLAEAVATAYAEQKPSMFELALLTVALLQCVHDRDLAIEALRGRMTFEGWGIPEMEELKENIDWECQGTDTKLNLSLERHMIHKQDPHLVMTLGRQLIRSKRVEDLRSMLGQLEEELVSPQEARRRHGIEIMADLAEALRDAGLPLDLENRMLAAARDRLSAENDQLVAQWCAQTVESVLGRWIASKNFRSLHAEMKAIGELAYPSVGAASWKPQLLRDLLSRLGSAPNIALLVPLLYRQGELPPAQVHAILALMGAPAAAYLTACLEAEEDPTRTPQLVEALKAFGRRAVPALQDLLGSSNPATVDHALMLLAAAGDRSVLPDLVMAVSHHDMRIRRTAVTAVAGLGGQAAAAKALAETMESADTATLLECLNILGDLGDPAALPWIIPQLTGGKASGDDAARIKLRVVEVLGRIPSPESVRPLAELFQKKGIFKGRESTAVRIAAARSLAALNTQEAREAMALAMESDPAEEVRAVLRQFLVR